MTPSSPRIRGNRSVCWISLGCPKNQVDSEVALDALRRAGFELTDKPEGAGLLVVNTCAFIHDAEQEAVQALLEAAVLKRQGRIGRLAAAGCLVARHGEAKLRRLIPEIDCTVVLHAAPHAWRALLDASDDGATDTEPAGRVLLSNPGTAYLKIAEGCNRRCTFCLIPHLRGPLQSKPLDTLVAEAEQLVARGAGEVILVAQDTSRYGEDRYGRPRLNALIDRLVKIPRLRWLRIMYTNPDGLTEGYIRRLAREPKVCRYIDMPVQHADPGVLRRMGRRGSDVDYLQMIKRLRRRIPGVALRTTLLSGFPGEDEQAHQRLQRFVRQAQFDRLGVFSFSRETGTAAARLAGQVHPRTKARRRNELMALQALISRGRLAARVGQKIECLVEEPSGPRHVIARTPWDAPEVDGGIVLTGRAAPGQFVQARITSATDHDLTGVIE